MFIEHLLSVRAGLQPHVADRLAIAQTQVKTKNQAKEQMCRTVGGESILCPVVRMML